MDNYPSHKHPHGLGEPNAYRIWVCEECKSIFNDDEMRDKTGWGHPCKMPRCKGRCESHCEPYIPDRNVIGTQEHAKIFDDIVTLLDIRENELGFVEICNHISWGEWQALKERWGIVK